MQSITAQALITKAHFIRSKSSVDNSKDLNIAIRAYELDENNADILISMMLTISEKNQISELKDKFERECDQ